MEPERGEERAREIEETATRYAINRWQSWVALVLLFLPDLLAVCAAVQLFNVLFAIENRDLLNRAGIHRGLLGFSEATLWAIAALLVVALAAYVAIFRRRFQWFRGYLERQPVRLNPSPPRPSRYPWAWKVFGLLPAASLLPMVSLVTRATPRLQMLEYLLWFGGLLALACVLGRIDRGAWPWRGSPFFIISIGLVTAYALAVYLGLPAPSFLLAPEAIFARVFGPLGLAFALSLMASVIYGRLQFRRLQRLLADTLPPADTDGTD